MGIHLRTSFHPQHSGTLLLSSEPFIACHNQSPSTEHFLAPWDFICSLSFLILEARLREYSWSTASLFTGGGKNLFQSSLADFKYCTTAFKGDFIKFIIFVYYLLLLLFFLLVFTYYLGFYSYLHMPWMGYLTTIANTGTQCNIAI